MKIKELIKNRIEEKKEIWETIYTKNFRITIFCDQEEMEENDSMTVLAFSNIENKKIIDKVFSQNEILEILENYNEEIEKIIKEN